MREFENSSRGENDTKKNSILNNQNKNVPNFGKGNNNHDVTMWNNPFAPSVDDVDDSNMIDLEPLNFDSRKYENSNLKSLNYGKSSSGSEEKNEENAGIRGSRSMNQGESGIVGGFSLTEGGLDEAAEHEVFTYRKMIILQSCNFPVPRSFLLFLQQS